MSPGLVIAIRGRTPSAVMAYGFPGTANEEGHIAASASEHRKTQLPNSCLSGRSILSCKCSGRGLTRISPRSECVAANASMLKTTTEISGDIDSDQWRFQLSGRVTVKRKTATLASYMRTHPEPHPLNHRADYPRCPRHLTYFQYYLCRRISLRRNAKTGLEIFGFWRKSKIASG